MTNCPCGTSKAYDDCCGPFIVGASFPDTPEQLMRSRYTAFTQANMDYIANTMANEALADFDKQATADWARGLTWQRLDILDTRVEGDKGFVEFIAHFAYHQDDQYLHELSEFHKINGKWVYIDGVEPPKNETVVNEIKLGRNEPCHCGSGKKYKKCCLAA